VAHPSATLRPASIQHNRYTNLISIEPGPTKPSPPLPVPIKSTVPNLLVQAAYFQSFFTNYEFPDESTYQRVADESHSGISLVY
jgi:hypothetical protein